MAPLVVLVAVTLLLRMLGWAGVSAFAEWEAATRAGLAGMFLFTAAAHFNQMRDDLVAMVPTWVPQPRLMVTLSGILEILGAVGLLIGPTSRPAAYALILLLIAVFPANVHAAAKQIPLRGRPPTPLWLRLPLQIVFGYLLWWSTR